MHIDPRPTAALIPYAGNAKLHSDAQIDQIAASIREFGFNNPVLIDPQGGIIAGHGRVLAAQRLGLEQVPCITLGHLTDAQRRAYIIADNRLGETGGGWDEQILAAELEALSKIDFSLELTGFDSDDIERLLAASGIDPSQSQGNNTPDQSSAKEINPDDFHLAHRCPRCGFEFDDDNQA